MRVLLDTCVWSGAVETIRNAGHDVIWSGDWQEDPGDEVILARAAADGRVFVTIDKDFGELAIVRSMAHAGIIRLVGFSARLQGAIVTVEPGRVRIRPPSDSADN